MVTGRLRESKGQAVVEFTFAFILFFTMFMSIVEFSHLFYTKLTLQHALREAGRYMITGRVAKDIKSGKQISRDQAVLNVFCGNLTASAIACPTLGAKSNFKFVCLDAACTQDGGGPDQTVMVTGTFRKQPLFPFFRPFFSNQGVAIEVSATWRNEPFPT